MARLRQITLGKEFKIGLPNYSNLTLHCEMGWDVAEGEEPDWDQLWDEVNRQLHIQSTGIDPSWLVSKEYQKFFKVTIKTRK